MFDLDSDGYISLSEMQRYLTQTRLLQYVSAHAGHVTPGGTRRVRAQARSETEQAFEQADVNRDGRVSMEEFLVWGADLL